MAVPGATAVTLPVLSTVATLGLLLLQEMRFMSASLGVTVKASFNDSFSQRVADDWLRVMSVMAAPRATILPKLLHGVVVL